MIRVLLILLMLWPVTLGAVQPDEVLEDPVLEERARDISKGLRCPVCQNESIDDSNANIARCPLESSETRGVRPMPSSRHRCSA